MLDFSCHLAPFFFVVVVSFGLVFVSLFLLQLSVLLSLSLYSPTLPPLCLPPCLILVIWPLFLVQLSLWHHIIGNSQMGARHPSPHAFEQVGTGSWVLQMRSSNKRLRNPSLQAKISHSDVCGSDIGQSRL